MRLPYTQSACYDPDTATRGLRFMDEIRTVLELLRGSLNASLQRADQRDEEWVILSNIMGNDGREFESAKDKLVMVLANIVQENTVSTVNTRQSDGVSPPHYFDLSVLLYANFQNQNYRQGLTMISRAIAFFQQNPWFSRDNLSDLPPSIDKLTIIYESLDVSALHDLMGMLGVKYLPSACYRIRTIPFSSGPFSGQA